MATYDQPAHTVPIFNPNLFTGLRYSANLGVVAPTGFLEFPVAQGAETFNYTANGNSVTIGEDGIAVAGGEFATPFGIAFSNLGFAYNNGATTNTISWETLQTKVQAIAPVSQAPNSTTLAVNNAISIQDGETTDPPVTSMVLSAAQGINTLSLNGDLGTAGQVLQSGGDAGTMYWGTGSAPGTVGTLAEVMDSAPNANIASRDLDMNTFSITNVNQLSSAGGLVNTDVSGNIGALYGNELLLQANGGIQLQIQADASANLVLNGPTLNPDFLTFSNQSLPITINGITYYLQLFNSP